MIEGIDSVATLPPDSTMPNLADETTADAIFGGDGTVKMGYKATSMLGKALSYYAHLIPRQFRLVVAFTRMTLAACWTFSALGEHILHVVFLGAKEKVVGSNTRSVIAGVTNTFAGWNRTVGQFPSNPMGEALIASFPNLLPEEGPIPVAILRTAPEPAPIAFVNFRPEPIRDWLACVATASSFQTPCSIRTVRPATQSRLPLLFAGFGRSLIPHIANLLLVTSITPSRR